MGKKPPSKRGLDEDSGRTGCRSNRGFEMRSDLRLPGLFIAHRRTVRNNNRSFRWSLHRRPARSFALRWLRGWYSWCCHPGCRRFCLHMRWTVFVRHPFRWQRKRADRPVPAVRLCHSATTITPEMAQAVSVCVTGVISAAAATAFIISRRSRLLCLSKRSVWCGVASCSRTMRQASTFSSIT